MHVTFREATATDAAAITQLSRQLGYHATVSGTAERLQAISADKAHCAIVAVAAGEVVGWIHGYCAIRLESEAFAEIGGLVVNEKMRGAGIGRQLIHEIVAWSKACSLTRIRVRTNFARLEAHQFYRKLGFEETKEQKVYDLKLS